jgi:hypothetical protein
MRGREGGKAGFIVHAVAVVFVVTAVCAPNLHGGAAPPSRARSAMQRSAGLTSAEECARCHVDIHRYWKASMHAQAADSSRFQALLRDLRSKGSAEPVCLRCHAPAAVYTRDVNWERKVSWEGVTCDFCHSVRGISNDPARPFVIQPGAVKTGPLKDAAPTTHLAQYAEVYTSSELCAPCHQFVNDKGLEVLTTFSEWKASPYPAKNTTCQSCHMRAATGTVVDPKVRRVAGRSVNVHDMPGGHSVVELNRALHAQITAVRRGNNVDVTVTVVNRGAGHRLPTGSPLRSLVLEVDADTGLGQRQTATRTYARVVVDEAGKELMDESGIWVTGGRVVRDDRLAPGEQRVEKFSFPMPASVPARAVARFYYRYAPDAALRDEAGRPFLSLSAWVEADGK